MLPIVIMLIAFPASSIGNQSIRQSELDRKAKEAREETARATREYRESLEKLLILQEQDVQSALSMVEQKRLLFSQREIDQKALDQSIQELEAARAKVRQTKERIAKLSSSMPTGKVEPIRKPSDFKQGLSNQETVPLNLDDVKFLDDAISELTRLGFIVAMLDNRITYNLEQAVSIMVRYCKCSRAEYLDYARGSGLPSIINRMENVKFSAADQKRLSDLSATIDGLKEYKASKEKTYNATKELLIDRMREAFNHSLSERIDLYNINLKEKKFVVAKQGEKITPIAEAVESYLADHIKNTTNEQVTKILRDELNEQTQTRKPPKKKIKKKSPIRII